MIVFDILSKYFWAMCILVGVLNTLALKHRAKHVIGEEMASTEQFKRILKWSFISLNLPWVVMGIGCLLDKDLTIWHYFRPRDGNVFVIVWWISIFLLWLLGFWWLFFRKGAETIAEYNLFAFFSRGLIIRHPLHIKLLYLFVVLVGIVVAVSMWMSDIPLPDFY